MSTPEVFDRSTGRAIAKEATYSSRPRALRGVYPRPVDVTLTSSRLGRVAIIEDALAQIVRQRMTGLTVAAAEVRIEALKAGP